MPRSIPIALLSLSTLTKALTITSPAPGEFINPGLPLTISWTSSASDPATVDFVIIHPSPDTPDDLATRTALGNSVAVSAGKLELPAWSVLDWGVGYTIQASAAGNPSAVVGTVADLSLGGGVGQAETNAAGSVTGFVSSSVGPAQESTSLTGAGNPSVTATSAPSGAATSVSGTASALTSATESTASETGLEATTSSSTTRASSTSRQSTSATASESAASTESSSAAVANVKAIGSIAAAGWLGLVLAAVLA